LPVSNSINDKDNYDYETITKKQKWTW